MTTWQIPGVAAFGEVLQDAPKHSKKLRALKDPQRSVHSHVKSTRKMSTRFPLSSAFISHMTRSLKNRITKSVRISCLKGMVNNLYGNLLKLTVGNAQITHM